jgi:Tol biopolymer transport system component
VSENMVGRTVGQYNILEMVGSGGMGDVYKALDSRLGRTVAFKVLKIGLAREATLRQRFDREAKIISGLSHPHICSCFDIGEVDDTAFLAMEYVDGQTLADHLHRGPLPFEQLMRYAIQIASALDEAHRRGIVHRDLKPSNIMLTGQKGRLSVKVLDFGLAKVVDLGIEAGINPDGTTLTETLTGRGQLLGTPKYMAPEQLEGREVDARTDIFAFGTILYEMATGKRAFDGKTPASVIASILGSEVPPLPAPKPSEGGCMAVQALDRVIHFCLAKDPDNRWQSVRDLMSELEWIRDCRASFDAADRERRRRPSEWLAWVLAACGVVAGIAGLSYHVATSAPPAATVRFQVLPPQGRALEGSIAVSPDGTKLAFASIGIDGTTSLWVRDLEALAARQLPGTEGALHPFWAPNGRSLGFFAAGKLKTIRVAEGPPHVLCDVFHPRGGSWSSQGFIVFAPNVGDHLYRVPDSGGTPEPATELNGNRMESSHQWPHFLPDGRRFLYLTWSEQPESRGIYVAEVGSKSGSRLLASDWGASFAPLSGEEGYLLFVRDRSLMAQPFHAGNLRLSGEASAVGEALWRDETTPGSAAFSASGNGVLAFRSGGVRRTQLTWFDRGGKRLGAVGPPGAYDDPSLAPDAGRVAASCINPQTGTHDIWLLEESRDVTSRFTFHASDEKFPLWSPDGRAVIFSASREGPPGIYSRPAGGSGQEALVLKSGSSNYPTDWSADGAYIIYATWDLKTRWDLWVSPRQGDQKPVPYLQNEFDSFQAVFSRGGDGRPRWVAYTSDESGRYEVYVQPFQQAGAEGKWQVSAAGGAQPQWGGSGTEIFYLAPDRYIMALPVKTSPRFEPGAPRRLFQVPVTGLVDSRNHFTATRDGQRFLVSVIDEQESPSPVVVALNWTP